MKQSVLYVPKGCTERYLQETPWNSFGEIREFEPTSVKSMPYIPENMEPRSFDFGGCPISDSHHGLRIELGPDGVKKSMR